MKPWTVSWINSEGLQATVVCGDDLLTVLQHLPNGIQPWEIVKVELAEQRPEVIQRVMQR